MLNEIRVFSVSNKKFTCVIEVNEKDIIIKTAPILRKFIGQNLQNLIKWCNSIGKTELIKLEVNKCD